MCLLCITHPFFPSVAAFTPSSAVVFHLRERLFTCPCTLPTFGWANLKDAHSEKPKSNATQYTTRSFLRSHSHRNSLARLLLSTQTAVTFLPLFTCCCSGKKVIQPPLRTLGSGSCWVTSACAAPCAADTQNCAD